MDLPPTHAISLQSTGGRNALTQPPMVVTQELLQAGRSAAHAIEDYGVGSAYAHADGSPLPQHIDLAGFTQTPMARTLVAAHSAWTWPLDPATFPRTGSALRGVSSMQWINPYDTAWETSSPALDVPPAADTYWG
jgi:hypothetical protein